MARFLPAFDFMLPNETGGRADGGYTRDPLDPGGETRWGVARNSHPDVDVRNLTKAGAMEIYRREYWDKLPGLDMVASQAAADKILDAAVHLGVRGGALAGQRAVNDVAPGRLTEDGVFGEQSAQAANGLDEQTYLIALVRRLAETYEIICSRHDAAYRRRYLAGFLNRARRLP
jgi:lysozyme family protein